MFTLVIRVTNPRDKILFEDQLWRVHLPLVKSIPSVRGIRVHKVVKAPVGEPALYGLIELCFDSKEALETAMDSREAKRAILDGSRLEKEAGTAMTFDYHCETVDA